MKTRFSNPLTRFKPQSLKTGNFDQSMSLFSELQNEMAQWMRHNSFDWTNEEEGFDFTPSCNAKETAKEYILQFDLPGIKKEDVSIELDRHRITIKGQRKNKKEEKDSKHFFSESFYGSFARSFHLPTAVDENGIDAHYEDGVLTITAPKTEPTKTKKIVVH